jgi:serine protease Do
MHLPPPDAPRRLAATTLAALALALMPAPGRAAGTITPQIQKHVRAATFEVVIKKPEKETVTYEKPLPLELIPFVERNDKYWPVGTAFAIAPDTFVTAAHVMLVSIGSQFGVPGIRDSEGKVYLIDRVLKFAAHEDFVVFTVSGAPVVAPFETSTTPALDTTVFAVGNALGEGVVVRDGLLTSFTPEAQDGKWKWLRFSAAASPGNSGGPLLDGDGRVIGVVVAKSPSENLNYALPIDTVLRFTDKNAVFDTRQSFGAPHLLQATVVWEFKDSFPLPLPYPQYASSVRAVLLKNARAELAKLAETEAPRLLPHGGSKILATLYASFDPTLLSEQDGGAWDAHSCTTEEATPLADDARVWHCKDEDVASLFRLQFAGTGVDERHYRDTKEFMDFLLKGVKTPRMVGQQAVRITSFGPAQQDTIIHDHYGRAWQLRVWSLGYVDGYILTLALPTPDGYVGFEASAPSFLLDSVKETLCFAADYLYLSYTGSLPQWRAFVDRRDLRPAIFEHLRLQYEPDTRVRLVTPRLQLDSAGLIRLGARSNLDVQMAYMLDHGKVVWDVGGVTLREDRDKATWIGAYRQIKPADDAGHDLRERWEHMSKRDGDFAGTPHHDNDFKNFWLRTVAGSAAAQSQALYEVVYNTDSSILPRQFDEIQTKVAQDLKVTE